jgi:hypothetical protein
MRTAMRTKQAAHRGIRPREGVFAMHYYDSGFIQPLDFFGDGPPETARASR